METYSDNKQNLKNKYIYVYIYTLLIALHTVSLVSVSCDYEVAK